MHSPYTQIVIHCPSSTQSGPGRNAASIGRALDLEFGRENAILDTTLKGGSPVPNHLSDSPQTRRRPFTLPRTVAIVLGFLRDAWRESRRFSRRPGLIHTHTTGCEPAPVAARLAGVPVVVGTFHVDPTYDLDRVRSSWPYRVLETISNHCLTMAIAVSHETARQWTRRTALPSKRVTVIPNGIDPEQFRRRFSRPAAREQLGLPADGLLIGHVGRLDRAKGPDVLLDAFARLDPVRQGLRVAFAGSGPMADELRRRADRTGFADRVHWLGYLNDVQVALDAFDVYAFPSRCETLGYALIEAMATELACVGSRVGGIPEVIVPGETGLIVPPNDPIALAAALQTLMDRPDLRERFGKAGRQRVVRYFHERDMVAKTLAVYARLLRGRHGHRHDL